MFDWFSVVAAAVASLVTALVVWWFSKQQSLGDEQPVLAYRLVQAEKEIAALREACGDLKVCAHRITELENDLNGVGQKLSNVASRMREDMKAMDTRIAGQLGRVELKLQGWKP